MNSCGYKYKPVNLGSLEYPDLSSTPFFPQEEYQCGPAALATILKNSGVKVKPEDLIPQVYLPQKKGSLQLELVAASRAYDRIPYVIHPSLDDLIEELLAGRPVLILQNYGLDILPSYHYAVVIGLLPKDKIILRSGKKKRHVMGMREFLMSWVRPGSWGMVVLRPGELPTNPDFLQFLQAVVTFEKVAGPQKAYSAFQAACSQWPEDKLLLFSMGNNALKRLDNTEAEKYFRRVLSIDETHLGALNNLADILARKGSIIQASQLINKALMLAERESSPFKDTIRKTQKEIEAIRTLGKSSGENQRDDK